MKTELSFPSTDWILIQETQVGSDTQRRSALGRLLLQYIRAMRVYVRARWQLSTDDADDLLQSFICDKFVLGTLLSKASSDRGKFRGYLLTCLDRYAISQRRWTLVRERAETELRNQAGPEIKINAQRERAARLFDAAWAEVMIGHCLRQVEQHCCTVGRNDLWHAFSARVVNPILSPEKSRRPSYRELAAELGLESPVQASNLVITGRRMFRRFWKSAVESYAGDGKDDDELDALREALELTERLGEFDGFEAEPEHAVRG